MLVNDTLSVGGPERQSEAWVSGLPAASREKCHSWNLSGSSTISKCILSLPALKGHVVAASQYPPHNQLKITELRKTIRRVSRWNLPNFKFENRILPR